MLRSLVLAVAAVFAVGAIGVPCWIALHRSDLPDPEDADLIALATTFAEGEDGFEAFRAAAAAAALPEDFDERSAAIRHRDAWEPDWLAGLIDANATALEQLERGLAAPRLRVPASALESADVMDPVFDVQQLVKLAGAEAVRFAKAGDLARAADRALLGMRVGHVLGGAENAHLLSLVMAVAMQSISLLDVEALARDLALGATLTRELIARLDGYRLDAAAWERAWAGEYASMRRSLLEASAHYAEPGAESPAHVFEGLPARVLGLLPPDYLWQPNRTLSSMARTYRRLQRDASLDCRAADASWSADESDLSGFRPLGAAFAPNAAGRFIVASTAPNLHRFDVKRCQLDTRIALVQTLLALRAHHAEEGALPLRLEELVPRHLARLPIDGFDGRPLRYARDAAVVYSVGDDFEDHGAPATPDATDAAAPAVSVAF